MGGPEGIVLDDTFRTAAGAVEYVEDGVEEDMGAAATASDVAGAEESGIDDGCASFSGVLVSPFDSFSRSNGVTDTGVRS